MLRSQTRSGAEQLESWRVLQRARDEENRQQPRRKVRIVAKIKFGDSLLDCTLLDISSHGARIVLEYPCDVPEFFSIFISPAGKCIRQCRLVWKSNLEIGLEFVTSANA